LENRPEEKVDNHNPEMEEIYELMLIRQRRDAEKKAKEDAEKEKEKEMMRLEKDKEKKDAH
jgi:hypothetical protein